MQFFEQAEAAEYIAAADREAFLKQMRQLGPKSRLACSPDKKEQRLQGDILREVPCTLLGPDEKPLFAKLSCLAMNTTCNLQPGRMESCNMALVIPYETYVRHAHAELPDVEKVGARLEALRANTLDKLFYIPQCSGFDGPIVVNLNSICTIDQGVYDKAIQDGRRLASLTQLGSFVYLVKISRFFARESHEVVREPLPELDEEESF